MKYQILSPKSVYIANILDQLLKQVEDHVDVKKDTGANKILQNLIINHRDQNLISLKKMLQQSNLI